VHQEIEQYKNNLEEMIKKRTEELHESNRALAAEQERLAVTLHSIGDGVITTDLKSRVVLINRVAEQLTGWPQDEVNGRPLSDIFQLLDEDGKPYNLQMAAILEQGSITAIPHMTALVARDGRKLQIADSIAPIRDKDSAIIGAVLVFRDVTRQLQLESEVLKVKKLESLGHLAGGIAHDFNNILAAILGNIDLAILDQTLNPKTRTILTSAEDAALRAKELTSRLLTFSKGGSPVKVTALLPEIIRDAANFVLQGKEIVCIYNFPDDLLPVAIDLAQIGQVIQNIITNSKQALLNSGVIKVSCRNMTAAEVPLPQPTTRHYVEISIHNNGPHIPATTLSKIFDPFFSTKSGHSGLGLTICHSIINKHHGLITVASTDGDGVTLKLTLPAARPKEPGKMPQSDAKQTTTTGLNVLIMDDEELVRDVTAAMLKQLGHKVVTAVDGTEAINKFKEAATSSQPIDLTMMDLTIPGGMGGEEAAKEFLKIDPTAKIVVSSGYSNDPIMANYQDYGFRAALSKPYQHQELLEVIQRLFP